MDWATVVVGIVVGLGSGLLATYVKLAEDRKVEVRRETIEALQDLAAMGTELFERVGEAIAATEDGPMAEEKRSLALDSLREARKQVDRLAFQLGPGNTVVATGAAVLAFLDDALEALPDEWPQVTFEEHEEAEIAALYPTQEDRDEYRAEIEGELWDEDIAEARLMRDFGLEGWGSFAEASALYMQRGVVPGPRAWLASWRRGRQRLRAKRHRRRYEREVAQRKAAALARQSRASKQS